MLKVANTSSQPSHRHKMPLYALFLFILSMSVSINAKSDAVGNDFVKGTRYFIELQSGEIAVGECRETNEQTIKIFNIVDKWTQITRAEIQSASVVSNQINSYLAKHFFKEYPSYYFSKTAIQPITSVRKTKGKHQFLSSNKLVMALVKGDVVYIDIGLPWTLLGEFQFVKNGHVWLRSQEKKVFSISLEAIHNLYAIGDIKTLATPKTGKYYWFTEINGDSFIARLYSIRSGFLVFGESKKSSLALSKVRTYTELSGELFAQIKDLPIPQRQQTIMMPLHSEERRDMRKDESMKIGAWYWFKVQNQISIFSKLVEYYPISNMYAFEFQNGSTHKFKGNEISALTELHSESDIIFTSWIPEHENSSTVKTRKVRRYDPNRLIEKENKTFFGQAIKKNNIQLIGVSLTSPPDGASDFGLGLHMTFDHVDIDRAGETGPIYGFTMGVSGITSDDYLSYGFGPQIGVAKHTKKGPLVALVAGAVLVHASVADQSVSALGLFSKAFLRIGAPISFDILIGLGYFPEFETILVDAGLLVGIRFE